MRYPVAYRSGARKYQAGGFQEPATVPDPGAPRNPMKPPYTAPPKPANDPYPRPDNDNASERADAPSARVPVRCHCPALDRDHWPA